MIFVCYIFLMEPDINKTISSVNFQVHALRDELLTMINTKANVNNGRTHENTVELIDFGGGDLNHAMSAWTSTSRDLSSEKIARIGSLLITLAENEHGTPFEKSYLQFLVHSDIASHIHMLKHRIGVSINGQSARYREFTEDAFYIPRDWPIGEQTLLEQHMTECFRKYHATVNILMSKGYSRARAKESARFYLPYGIQIYTDISFNMRSFAHFVTLRSSQHAQVEIKEISVKMLKLVSCIPDFEKTLDAMLGNEKHKWA